MKILKENRKLVEIIEEHEKYKNKPECWQAYFRTLTSLIILLLFIIHWVLMEIGEVYEYSLRILKLFRNFSQIISPVLKYFNKNTTTVSNM